MAAALRRVFRYPLEVSRINSLISNSGSQLLFSKPFSAKLFVKGVSFSSTEKKLTEAFSEFGQVTEVKIIKDKARNRSKGYGFVTFATKDDAQKALEGMNGKLLDGRIIRVAF